MQVLSNNLVNYNYSPKCKRKIMYNKFSTHECAIEFPINQDV